MAVGQAYLMLSNAGYFTAAPSFVKSWFPGDDDVRVGTVSGTGGTVKVTPGAGKKTASNTASSFSWGKGQRLGDS
jgi:hypothetical protein